MDIEFLRILAEKWSSLVFLWVFIRYFLTKFSQTQEKIANQMVEINISLMKMTDKIITSDGNQVKIAEHLGAIEDRLVQLEKYQKIR